VEEGLEVIGDGRGCGRFRTADCAGFGGAVGNSEDEGFGDGRGIWRGSRGGYGRVGWEEDVVVLFLGLFGDRKAEGVFYFRISLTFIKFQSEESRVPISLHAKLVPGTGSLKSGSRA